MNKEEAKEKVFKTAQRYMGRDKFIHIDTALNIIDQIDTADDVLDKAIEEITVTFMEDLTNEGGRAIYGGDLMKRRVLRFLRSLKTKKEDCPECGTMMDRKRCPNCGCCVGSRKILWSKQCSPDDWKEKYWEEVNVKLDALFAKKLNECGVFETKKEEKSDAIREHPLIGALDSRTRSHSASIGDLHCKVGALRRRIVALEEILSRTNSCGNCQGYYEGKVIFTTKEGTCRDCGRLVTATLKEQKKGKKKCPRKKPSPKK